MADQATLNQTRGAAKPTNGMMGGIGAFGGHLATLATLQARLAALDLKESTSKVAPWAVLVVTSALLALAGLTVLLNGAGRWLATASGLALGTAFLITGAIALILSAVIAWFSASRIGGSFTSFRRTSEELERNIAWIRTVMEHSGR
jgi:hypothetical protein